MDLIPHIAYELYRVQHIFPSPARAQKRTKAALVKQVNWK